MTTHSLSPARRDEGDRAAIVALILVMTAGATGTTFAPFMMNALGERGLSLQDAGGYVTVELIAAFFSASLLAVRIDRDSRAGWAIAGGLIAAAGASAGAYATSESHLLMARAIAGLGQGLLASAALAAAAGTRNPDRLLAIALAWRAGFEGVVLAVLPPGIERLGPSALFLALALLALGAVVSAGKLPATTPLHSSRTGGKWPNMSGGMVAIPASFLVSGSLTALWTVSYEIGLGAGFNESSLGIALGASSATGLAGAVAAPMVASRMGRTIPLMIGLAIATSGMVATCIASSYAIYAAGLSLVTFGLLFGSPFILGLLAALDSAGRWTSVAGGAGTLGSAIGPVAITSASSDSWPALLAASGTASALLFGLSATLGSRGAKPQLGDTEKLQC